MRTYVTRRAALRLLGGTGVAALAAACSQAPVAPAAAGTGQARPPSAAAPAQTAAMSDADWAKVVDSARQEGVLQIATYTGTGFRRVMDDFQAAYPGISVEQTGFQSSSRDFFPRFFQERQAGLYQWDLLMVPATEVIVQAIPQHAVEPLRPLLVRADVLDDKSWLDGFEGGWLDADKNYSYAITRSRSQSLWIDTNQVQPGDITSYKSLLDPRWKGKILAGDPRTKGSGFWPTTVMRVKTGGDAIVTQLYKDQAAQLSTDTRQLLEFAVRGSYPISIGAVAKNNLPDFLAQGIGQNLKNIPFPEIDYLNSADHVLHYVNRAPHPNVARVFANWVLSKDGGASVSKNVTDNSRRADVPVYDPDLVADRSIDWVVIDSAPLVDEILKTQDVAKAVLG